jgi:23S rRNA (cytidine1920-2'-O)/16S rRNA (cytidine1409-2'-O)-methyltransferase
MRADIVLSKLEKISRNKASEMIKSAKVYIDGKLCKKASCEIEQNAKIEIVNTGRYVSRSAYKLLDFIETTTLDIRGCCCLDIGASKGGWSEVLLEKGAKTITAIDVGTDQLHEKLRSDSRVVSYEKTDVRAYESKPFDLVVCDASFIALEHIIDDINRLSKDKILLLFKPQFEVGRAAKRNKRGVVLDQSAIQKAIERFIQNTKERGWIQQRMLPCSIYGKEGNLEYMFYYTKQ